MSACTKLRKPADYYQAHPQMTGDVAKERFYLVDQSAACSPIPVTVYWGPTGIGKSWMLRDDMITKQEASYLERKKFLPILILSAFEDSDFFEFPHLDTYKFPVLVRDSSEQAISEQVTLGKHLSHIEKVERSFERVQARLRHFRNFQPTPEHMPILCLDAVFEEVVYLDDCIDRLAHHMARVSELASLSDATYMTMQMHPNHYAERMAKSGWRLSESV